MSTMRRAAVDEAEVEKFRRMSGQWWDETGEAAPLHRMNPCRLEFITAQMAAQFGRDPRRPAPFDGLSLLDAGCGGGLVSEPMARLGARVTGIDANEAGIAVARAHAAGQGLSVDYRVGTVDDLVAARARFDVVLALEIVEHVPDPAGFVAALAALLRDGGLLVMSTLNRTPRSFLAAIVGAEWVLRWLPRGTHDWRRFPTPVELAAMLRDAGLSPVARSGMVYAPLSDRWSLDADDLSVNYLMAATV